MSAVELDNIWSSAFGEGSTRPVLYSSEELNDEGWQPLTDPQNFILKIPTLNHLQLHAASSNNQVAMKSAQDEYLEIEQQIAGIKGKRTIQNPQTFPDLDVYEEQKESSLYGYKYDPNRPALLHAGLPAIRSADKLTEQEKHDVRLFQEPFEQGGFVPKDREYKSMLAKAKNPNNIDGFEPVIKGSRRLVPKQQTHHDEYNITYVKRIVDQNGEIVRPVSPTSSEVPGETPDKAVNKRLTRTRFDGKKFPPTRDGSEDPSEGSTPRGRKRATSSGDESRAETPSSKRQKVLPTINGLQQARPKHPNQYTKAKERAALEGISTGNGTPAPPATTKAVASSKNVAWRDLTPDEKYTHTWTNAELHEAVREDHTWLHDDPAKAQQWKKKLLENQNPIRSFAMFKKWRYWKANDLDKRPRNKQNGNENGVSNQENEDYAPSQKPKRNAAKPKKLGDSGTSTPAMTPAAAPSPTPAPDVVDGDEEVEQVATPVVKPRRTKASAGKEQGSDTYRPKGLQHEKDRESSGNNRQSSTDSGTPSTADEESPTKTPSKEFSRSGRELRRPSLKHQGSESTILVKPANTMAMASTHGTPMRRSARNRRGSA